MTPLRIFFGAALLSLHSLALAATAGAVSGKDKNFFEKAAASGMEEVAVSQAALPHLSDPKLRDFAQMMVSDHTAANDELKALAAKKNVTLPAKKPDTDKWSKGNNKGFDADYADKMAKDHVEAVELFMKTAAEADDPEVKAFAAKTLPKLQHHLSMAQGLKQGRK